MRLQPTVGYRVWYTGFLRGPHTTCVALGVNPISISQPIRFRGCSHRTRTGRASLRTGRRAGRRCRSIRAERRVENFLGLGGLGKDRVAAQVAEHDDDLAAMAFEDLLVVLRDDEFSRLRREKSV